MEVRISKSGYVAISVLTTVGYMLVLIFGIAPLMLYIVTAILCILSFHLLLSNWKLKKIILVFGVVLIFSLLGIMQNGLDVLINDWQDKTEYASRLNSSVLISFLCLANAFVFTSFVNFLFEIKP